MKRGLLIGRYQPPHLGHLMMIKSILKECDELIIVVAAAQMSFSIKNPFTASERLVMIRSMLINASIDITKIWLIPVQDVLDNDIWVTHMMRMIPPVDIVYGNNPFTRLLFAKANIRVKTTDMFERKLYEARQIRNKIAYNENIAEYVDETVAKYLEMIDAHDRLSSLIGTDSITFKDASSNIKE